jgi:hypothetical protein
LVSCPATAVKIEELLEEDLLEEEIDDVDEVGEMDEVDLKEVLDPELEACRFSNVCSSCRRTKILDFDLFAASSLKYGLSMFNKTITAIKSSIFNAKDMDIFDFQVCLFNRAKTVNKCCIFILRYFLGFLHH